MIYEIRNYHFRPDLIDAYKAWAKAEAIRILPRNSMCWVFG